MGHQNPAAGVTGGKRWGPSPEWTRQSWFRPFEASATPERDHAGLQDTPAPAPKVTAMYLEFFGLREAPFELTPNPQFLFLTPSTRTAFQNIQYGLSTGKGVTVVTGDPGVGKTYLFVAALNSDACTHVRTVLISNPIMTRAEFVQAIAVKLGLSREIQQSKALLVDRLEQILIDARLANMVVALVIDEAHRLSDELLEELRLLDNVETMDEKLLPIVLLGQPSLTQRLSEPQNLQLTQRVAVRSHVECFSDMECGGYIASRVRAAGGEPSRLFTRDAVIRICELSRGTPRTINVLCDNALLVAFSARRRLITREVVDTVNRQQLAANDQVTSSDSELPDGGTLAAKPSSEPGLS